MTRDALLRQPVPGRLGTLRAAVRCLPADGGSLAGGDLFDVVRTPFGIRLIIGDVMGKGPAAAGIAGTVLGAFRELVRHEPTLPGIAVRLDRLLHDHNGREEFVTALIAGLRPAAAQADLVFCGHPPPLLLRAGAVSVSGPLVQALPLGLFDLVAGWYPAVDTVPFRPGDGLLFYTDGVSEARSPDGGGFYLLEQRAAELRRADPEDFLAALEQDLLRHVAGRLQDDAALLLLSDTSSSTMDRMSF